VALGDVSGQLHAHLQGKSPQYPLDRRLDGAQSWLGCDDEEKTSLLHGHCILKIFLFWDSTAHVLFFTQDVAYYMQKGFKI
jgi:hypothetical protein